MATFASISWTGKTRQWTRNADWDEHGAFLDGGRKFVYSSGQGLPQDYASNALEQLNGEHPLRMDLRVVDIRSGTDRRLTHFADDFPDEGNHTAACTLGATDMELFCRVRYGEGSPSHVVRLFLK